MAESTANGNRAGQQDGPTLRRGRPADPAVPGSAPEREPEPIDAITTLEQQQINASAPSVNRPSPPAPSPQSEAAHESGGDSDETTDQVRSEPDDMERRFAESRQRRLKRLLRQCERVNLIDFNVLSLAGWPDNYTLAMARRRRDLWMMSAIVAALVFLSGMTGLVPAWIAGGGFGAFMVILMLGLPFIRRLYTSTPSYLDLILYRRQLLQDARRHVAHLEGELGLIWQCNELSDFNPTLASPRFSTLKHLSEQRRLAGSLTRRDYIRLYLIFMLEAEKAYERMQAAYFEDHRKAIERGWESVAAAVVEKSDTVADMSVAVVSTDESEEEPPARHHSGS